MKLQLQGVGVKVGPNLTKRITAKLEKFQKYFTDEIDAKVKCSTEGSDLRKVELTLFIRKHIYRTEKTAADLLTAFNLALDVIEGQIRKHKSKMAKRYKDFDYIEPFFEEESDDSEMVTGGEPNFRYKTFELRPMSDEEAALQMELLDHDFFVYLAEDSGQVNVIYKRHDKDYGVIKTEHSH